MRLNWLFNIYTYYTESTLKPYHKSILKTTTTIKKLYDPFYRWGSTASRLEPIQGGSLLFTTTFPEIPGTHFINLGRMKGWVDLGATQWFWTREAWIGNPPCLNHYASINTRKPCIVEIICIIYIQATRFKISKST